MEPRASHLLIGTFLLIVAAAVFGFVIWLAKVEIDREFAYYEIYFEESVSGLSIGGDVRYSGIPIGSVAEIALDPDNPRLVRVRIEVGSDAPIRQGTKATLALQGITGVAFIQLTGGQRDAAEIEIEEGREFAIIPSEQSAIQRLFTTMPELIGKVIGITDSLATFLEPENQKAFGQIMTNAAALVGRLNARGPEIEALILDMQAATAEFKTILREINVLVGQFQGVSDNVDATLQEAREAIKGADKAIASAQRSFENTMGTADELLDGDIRAAVDRFGLVADNVDKALLDARTTIGHADTLIDRDVRATVASAKRAIDRLDSMAKAVQDLAADNEEAIKLFTSDGLVEFIRFLEEARNLVQTATTILEDIGSDPAQLLFGTGRGGVKPE